MLSDLFAAIDAKDVDRFAAFLAPHCSFRFANQPAVEGVAAIRRYVHAFLGSIGSIRHVINTQWELPGAVICHGQVRYTRHDGSVLEVPFANVLVTGPQGITEYRVFVDASALHA